jgi:GDP-4-dehydro-6-deoxy-D-mannose reductase
MPKKVLITGITGMAGSHLAELLIKEEPDCQVFGTKRWRSSLVNIDAFQEKLVLIDCNLTDATDSLKLIEAVRPDYVFHLAAHSFVPDSWKAPHVTLHDNMIMQLNVFEAVRHTGMDPVIHVALSSEEYGRVFPGELPITEKNPFRPLSPYAVSKVVQDMLAYQYHQSYGMRVIRTRAFNHEGPRRGEVFVTSNFAKQIAEIEAGLKPPVLYVGNLNARRDWSDVRDVVRAYWLSVHHCVPGDDYVIASGVSRSIREMLDYLLSLSKVKIEVAVDPARQRPSDVELLVGDASKFKEATGWSARYTFEQTMSDLLDYWRQRVRWGSAGRVGA